jgi:hypothetical protein
MGNLGFNLYIPTALAPHVPVLDVRRGVALQVAFERRTLTPAFSLDML